MLKLSKYVYEYYLFSSAYCKHSMNLIISPAPGSTRWRDNRACLFLETVLNANSIEMENELCTSGSFAGYRYSCKFVNLSRPVYGDVRRTERT